SACRPVVEFCTLDACGTPGVATRSARPRAAAATPRGRGRALPARSCIMTVPADPADLEDNPFEDVGNYWLSDVNRLFRWLRLHDCNDYAMGTGARRVVTLTATSSQEDAAEAMDSALDVVAHVLNEPPEHLTRTEHHELQALVTTAMASL